MILRPFQSDMKQDIYDAWNAGIPNILAVAPTGSGKTCVTSSILMEHKGASCAIAHRQELVNQISSALNVNEVKHRIIGPDNVVRLAVKTHMSEVGKSYYEPSAPCAVAGVDTLMKRHVDLKPWCDSVTKWIVDEGHHNLVENKWGKAVALFPNAIGLGVTATAGRADGKGLGRHHDGVYDTMVEGPTMRELIDQGFLVDYRIIAPPPSFLMDEKDIGTTGDFKRDKVVKKFRANKSKVIGDIVGHYLKFAKGKLGLTFVPDIQDAIDTAKEFNDAGVPAAVISSKTPDAERISIQRRFKNRELLQIVNVDIYGEGTDLPGVEVVSMARPTASLGLFIQQFGRALRLLISKILSAAWGTYTDAQRLQFIAESEKPYAMIIDHVGNVHRHRLPDAPRTWTLDRRDKRAKNNTDDEIPTRTCLNPECLSVYERIYKVCPYCGHKVEVGIGGRASPEFVDGDLTELDAATLAAMRGEIARVDMDPEELRAEQNKKYVASWKSNIHVKQHVDKQESQKVLRDSISMWAGYHRSLGKPDSEIYRRFYFMFGIDIMTAQTLGIKEANALNERLKGVM